MNASSFRLVYNKHSRLLAGAATTTCSAGVLLLLNNNQTSAAAALEQQQQDDHAAADTPSHHFRIEVDLMDKIASKSYLNPTSDSTNFRPTGVPKRIRILALDVPEMRHVAFDGECRRVHKADLFVDGTAPDKKVRVKKQKVRRQDNNHTDEHLLILQKSLIHSLTKCRNSTSKRIGVELLEGSVSNLNPHNMRRTHQFGNFLKFDPGKYTTKRAKRRVMMNVEEREEDSEDIMEDDNNDKQSSTTKQTTRSTTANTDIREDKGGPAPSPQLATEEDEVDAPWHQYAWIQELQLRIHGRVMFGEPMQPASRVSRLINGTVYKSTVPSQRHFYEWFLPSFLHSDPSGMDGSKLYCWASQKPHAVIADGAAMQRVPGSLRFLQRTCEDAHVPLYIIHDPRVWGGNTHQDLDDALRDMRKTIKQNIVTQAMQGSSSFQRGRMLGQMETEAAWQAKDLARRTRQSVKDANDKIKRERENDWSKLDATGLQERLVEHRAIVKKKKDGENSIETVEYSRGLLDLARQCLSGEEEQSRMTSETASAVENGEVEPVLPPEKSDTPL